MPISVSKKEHLFSIIKGCFFIISVAHTKTLGFSSLLDVIVWFKIVKLPYPGSGDSQGQETFLAPPADKQTRNYDTECSNHQLPLSILSSKGLSCSKMKWWAVYTNLPENYIYILHIYNIYYIYNIYIICIIYIIYVLYIVYIYIYIYISNNLQFSFSFVSF